MVFQKEMYRKYWVFSGYCKGYTFETLCVSQCRLGESQVLIVIGPNRSNTELHETEHRLV